MALIPELEEGFFPNGPAHLVPITARTLMSPLPVSAAFRTVHRIYPTRRACLDTSNRVLHPTGLVGFHPHSKTSWNLLGSHIYSVGIVS